MHLNQQSSLLPLPPTINHCDSPDTPAQLTGSNTAHSSPNKNFDSAEMKLTPFPQGFLIFQVFPSLSDSRKLQE